MYVNAGKLNKRIMILRKMEQVDSEGYLAPPISPEVVHTCWAQYTQTSGTEMVKSNADFGEAKVRFLIRHTGRPIDRKMIVRYAGEDYEIRYINGYGDSHEYLEIWCDHISREGTL